MRKIEKIIIHCTATPEGRPVTVKEVDAWHRQRGFAKIGYHFLIYLDGSMHTGREIEEIGAHCEGQNSHSIGICYVGGLAKDGKTAKDTRTEAQKESLVKLIGELKRQFPNVTIHGHREFANKACPCFDVKKEFN